MSAKSSFHDVIRPNKYLLNFLGFWPRDPDVSSTYQILAGFRIAISMLVISTMFVPEILTLIVFWGDIAMLTSVGSVTIEVTQLVFKMFYMIAQRSKFYRMYASARELWLVADDDREREKFEELPKLANRMTICLFIMGMSNVFTFVPVSIAITINNYRRANGSDYIRFLPLEMWYGIDMQRSPNFEIALCCQTIAMTYCVFGIAGFDATMVTLILHVSSQFRLISMRFRYLGEEIKLRTESEVRLKIGQYIDHHNQILRMASEMRELLSPVIFVQLMSSGLEICLCGYTLITKGGSSSEVTKYIIYTITMFLQLVLWCWPGELLIQESTAIGETICNELPWYLLPAARQRDLGFIVARTRRMCCVTALSFQVMSMRKLTEVFNTAASYFALLRNMTYSQN